MKFSDIIGQEAAKSKLHEMVAQEKIPHALMFTGIEGCGSLPLALTFAQLLLCKGDSTPKEPTMSLFGFDEPEEEETSQHDPCGKCSGCKMSEIYQHPDLHFMFPIFKKYGTSTTCDDLLPEWRELLQSNPYFSYSEWMEAIGAENQQLMIYESESDSLSRKLSLVASQGGYKVCVVWLPERMNPYCANKILKLLEEPPAKTVFLMASEHPEGLLPTIRSRVQTIVLPRLSDSELSDALVNKHHVDAELATQLAHTVHGNYSQALKLISSDNENETYFNLFVELMRLSYMRKVKEMKQWSERVAKMGREHQRRFLAYCQHMVRENFMYNFHESALNYMSAEESGFAVKFAPFINENNVIGMMRELQLCDRDIGQNGNAKIVFFDFALKMIVLIKNR